MLMGRVGKGVIVGVPVGASVGEAVIVIVAVSVIVGELVAVLVVVAEGDAVALAVLEGARVAVFSGEGVIWSSPPLLTADASVANSVGASVASSVTVPAGVAVGVAVSGKVAVLVGVSVGTIAPSVVAAAATGVVLSPSSSSKLLKTRVVTHSIALRPKKPIAVSIKRKPRRPACRRLCHILARRPRRKSRSASKNKMSPIAKTPAVRVGRRSVNSLSVMVISRCQP